MDFEGDLHKMLFEGWTEEGWDPDAPDAPDWKELAKKSMERQAENVDPELWMSLMPALEEYDLKMGKALIRGSVEIITTDGSDTGMALEPTWDSSGFLLVTLIDRPRLGAKEGDNLNYGDKDVLNATEAASAVKQIHLNA